LRSPTRKTVLLTATFGLAWIATVFLGVRALLNYENTPGRIGVVSQSWPGSRIPHVPGFSTLVMLAHPHCPCTRASVGELALIMAQVRQPVAAYVLFLKPAGSAKDWEKTDLWQSAAAIPGVTVVADFDGDEARRFGVETSGHTLLFNSAGQLVFSGGITQSRGHSGDNLGRTSIVSLLNKQTVDRAQSYVFGCSLADSVPTGR
jgi:hypothetical protein